MTREEAGRLIDELFETWYPSLFRYLLRVTHSIEFAEDVAQETFMELYRALARGHTVDNAKAWTLRVAKRRVQREIHQHARNGPAMEALEAFETTALPVFNSPAKSLEWEELVGFFSALSPREEEVLLLRLEGLKYREIASQLGISANSVSTLLVRALAKLRAKLGVCLPGPEQAEKAVEKRGRKPLQ